MHYKKINHDFILLFIIVYYICNINHCSMFLYLTRLTGQTFRWGRGKGTYGNCCQQFVAGPIRFKLRLVNLISTKSMETIT